MNYKNLGVGFYYAQVFILFWGGIAIMAIYRRFVIALLMIIASYLANLVLIEISK